eukprot:1096671-Lingulodinium_polyedra.AAC.1
MSPWSGGPRPPRGGLTMTPRACTSCRTMRTRRCTCGATPRSGAAATGALFATCGRTRSTLAATGTPS